MINYVKEMLDKELRDRLDFDAKYLDFVECGSFIKAVRLTSAYKNDLRIQYDMVYGWSAYKYSDPMPIDYDLLKGVLWIDRIESNWYRVHGVKNLGECEYEFSEPNEENFELMTYEQVLDCAYELDLRYKEGRSLWCSLPQGEYDAREFYKKKFFKAWCVNDKNEIKTVELPRNEDELKGLTLCTDWTVGPDKLNEVTNLAYLTQFGVGAKPLFDYESVTDDVFESMGIEKGMTLEDLNEIATSLFEVDEDRFEDLMIILGTHDYDKEGFNDVVRLVNYGDYRIIKNIYKRGLGEELIESEMEWRSEEEQKAIYRYLFFYTTESYEWYVDNYILEACNCGSPTGWADYDEEKHIFVQVY